MRHQYLLRYTCSVPFKKIEACKVNQTDAARWVLSHRNEDGVFLLEVVYDIAKGLVWLTMI